MKIKSCFFLVFISLLLLGCVNNNSSGAGLQPITRELKSLDVTTTSETPSYNLRLTVATLKDEYEIGEDVDLTDPPQQSKENKVSDQMISAPDTFSNEGITSADSGFESSTLQRVEIDQLISRGKDTYEIQLDWPGYFIHDSLKYPKKFFSSRKLKIVKKNNNKKISSTPEVVSLSKRDLINKNFISSVNLEAKKKEDDFTLKIPPSTKTGYYTIDFQVEEDKFLLPIEIIGLTENEKQKINSPLTTLPLDDSISSVVRLGCGKCYWESVSAINPLKKNYGYFVGGIGGVFNFIVQTTNGWTTSEVFQIDSLTVNPVRNYRGDPKLAFTTDGKLIVASMLRNSNIFGETVSTGGLFRDSNPGNAPPQFTQILLSEIPSEIPLYVELGGAIFDYEKISIDKNSNSNFYRNTYIFANAVYSSDGIFNQGLFVVNPQGEISLKRPPGGPFVQSTVVGPNGELYAAKSKPDFDIFVSLDGGNTFNKNTIAQITNDFCLGRVSSNSPKLWKIYSGPELAVDENGRLFAAWSNYEECIEDPDFEFDQYAYNYDIFFSFSDNEGSSWSDPIKINDDDSGGDQGFPSITVEEGVVYVAFLDHRDFQDEAQFDVYYSKSVDSGLTFSENIRVNDFSVPNVFGYREPGDYLDMVSVGKNKLFISHPCVDPQVTPTGNPTDGCVSIVDIKNKSQIQNFEKTPTSGLLSMKVQKNISGEWQDDTIIISNSDRTVPAQGVLALDQIWNPLGWLASEQGEYRVYSEFNVDRQIWSDSYEFTIRSPQICGNGILEDGEQCDDGNLLNNDGCDSTCNIVPPKFCENVWNKTIGGPNQDSAIEVQETTDKGFVIVGWTENETIGSKDILLIKIDSLGNEEWSKTFGGANRDVGLSVQQTSDEGYIITGETDSFGTQNYSVFLLKTDSLGNEEWLKTFEQTNFSAGDSVKQTSDGGYIISGWSFEDLHGNILLIKTDPNGNEEWANKFGVIESGRGKSVIQNNDDEFVVTGSLGATEKIIILKVDSIGNLVWEKKFDHLGVGTGEEVQQTIDGGYVIAGTSGSGTNLILIKTDLIGDYQWTKTFGGTGSELGYSVKQTTEGGFVIAGRTRSFGEGNNDFWLVKTDGFGNICDYSLNGNCSEEPNKFAKTFGSINNEQAFSVQQTTDGGYIIAGNSDITESATNILIIKTDGYGNSSDDCPPCGNGTIDEGEQCDDGNLLDGDECNSSCEQSFCPTNHRYNVNGTCTASFEDPIEDGHIGGGIGIKDSESEVIIVGDAGDNIAGFVEWDISSIPDTAYIIDTFFLYHTSLNDAVSKINKISLRPSQSNGVELFNAITQGDTLVDVEANFPGLGTKKEINLGAQTALQNRLESDWFAIGFHYPFTTETASMIYSEESPLADPKPTLIVKYYPNPYCGNGITETGEACDDSGTESCDGCKADCSREDDVCGDEIIECGEVCERGDSKACRIGSIVGTKKCNSTCNGWNSCKTIQTCFLENTEILTPIGNKKIQELKVGDTVMSYNEQTGSMEPTKVVETFVHETDSYLIINGELKVTPNHPMQINGKWTEIGSAKIGDKIKTINGEETINSIEIINEKTKVYNIEVEKNHNYYAEDYLAHNKIGGREI